MKFGRLVSRVVLAWFILAQPGCTSVRPGRELVRAGDEIVVCGRLFHSGTRVVLWSEPGGYDAYRVERRFSPLADSDWESTLQEDLHPPTPNRFGLRKDDLSEGQLERVRGGGWDLPLLEQKVDQFVLHYDASGTSRRCFEVLHDRRGLSVHFMLDVDGTLYQTLDLKERAWHATTSNSRSIGIEIAQAGAFPTNRANRLADWYQSDAKGIRLKLPAESSETGVRVAGFIGRPARAELVKGTIQGIPLAQYDFTPEQYAALVKLTATLCQVFPRLRPEYPRDGSGQLVPEKLPESELANFRGVLGHYHIQTDKVDPGPAFQWESFMPRVRRELQQRGSEPGRTP